MQAGRILRAILIVAISVVPTLVAAAGQAVSRTRIDIEELRFPLGDWSTEERIYLSESGLVTATVLGSSEDGTQGKPPVVHVRIDRLLYGRAAGREMDLAWRPASLYMPCTVGEEAYLRQWAATPLPAPPPGSRWILVLAARGASTVSIDGLRWPYTPEQEAHFVQVTPTWPALKRQTDLRSAEEMRRLAARNRQEARDQVDAIVASERSWAESERERARTADIEALVRTASDVVIADTAFNRVEQVDLAVGTWLKRSRPGLPGRSHVRLFVGSREESLVTRWDRPRLRHGLPAASLPSLSRIAFLRFVHDPIPGWADDTEYRLVESTCSFLPADAHTLSRVRAAVRKLADAPLAPPPGYGAPLSEFLRLSSDDADRVLLKVTPVPPSPLPPFDRNSLVLSLERPAHALDPGALGIGGLETPRYVRDYLVHGHQDLELQHGEMRRLLDGLEASAELWSQPVQPGDSLSLMLRRVEAGRERVFECTLDHARLLEFSRILASVFPDTSTALERRGFASGHDLLSENLAGWAQGWDRATAKYWFREPRAGERPAHR